jgi:hypothetical protein
MAVLLLLVRLSTSAYCPGDTPEIVNAPPKPFEKTKLKALTVPSLANQAVSLVQVGQPREAELALQKAGQIARQSGLVALEAQIGQVSQWVRQRSR